MLCDLRRRRTVSNDAVAMIGLAEAAHRLAIAYQDAHRLLLTGHLRGEKRRSRWYVLLSDVERLAQRRASTPEAPPQRIPLPAKPGRIG